MKKSKTLSMTLYYAVDTLDNRPSLFLVSGNKMAVRTFLPNTLWLNPDYFCCFDNVALEPLNWARFPIRTKLWSKTYQSDCDCSE